ncbi:MAG TPA: threonine--tRNA ligase [Polyangiaceae bacterium]|jgi:threonyl-tRNA synthetase|nr:MAG: Threonine--tRNA ligase 2 [Deltaproteobacteria bacterium ADurb.Bin207]HNZ25183.1 threonine--tRNA ligase [Polyangiaceae bacterium]HOD24979.1 threonine--tRNA ligase [Polyangiaceae bacterium]HOE50631.1 threonine--tRNA ligase [Polyangiaceae bacterium]HOH03286.1 threonine--tRNA ligase [Polyangiaceae bacterium]
MPIIAKKIERDEREECLYRIRHSTAHLMAEAVQVLFPGTKLAFGPPVQDGFYYDFDSDHRFTDEDLKTIESKMRELAKKKSPFVKKSISKAEALRLFEQQGEKLKAEHVQTLSDGEITLYESGGFVDLCAGPHVESTAQLEHFKLTNVSGSYWRGDEKRERLQRIYGTAWDSKQALKAHLARIEEAKKRDHRVLGKELGLFEFPELAGPGLPFYLPKGARVLQQLKDWMWQLHITGGYGHPDKTYEPLATPHILRTDAWKISGHLENYRENMFMVYSLDELDQGLLTRESREDSQTNDKDGLGNYGLKPMNCPGHVMLFNVGTKSYRDLPARYFEFGTVYRYERAGTLHGMLRVRSFTQDDAHLFCTPDNVAREIEGVFDFCCHILDTFGFDYHVGLKTRPESRLGTDEIWDMAENGLRAVLEKRAAGKYYVQEGDATFYGPKIDFTIRDCLGREWQGGTIQLDFNLPERFELEYTDADNTRKRPVMIHRAILGSFERFFGLLIEEFGGAFPLWLAPIHVRVLPIGDTQLSYAQSVVGELKRRGFRAELDDSNDKLGKKIRNGKMDKVPYLVVVGQKEVDDKTITTESYHDGKLEDVTTVDALSDRMNDEIERRVFRRRA